MFVWSGPESPAVGALVRFTCAALKKPRSVTGAFSLSQPDYFNGSKLCITQLYRFWGGLVVWIESCGRVLHGCWGLTTYEPRFCSSMEWRPTQIGASRG
jgi:hypothetical protein